MAQLGDKQLLALAQAARDEGHWSRAVELYGKLTEAAPQSAEYQHNLGLSYLGLGNPRQALLACTKAFALNPRFWQSAIVIAKSHKELDQIGEAQKGFKAVLAIDPKNASAKLGLADLALNYFGEPLEAIEWVKTLTDAEYRMDVKLTSMMAKLYDRQDWDLESSAITLTNEIKEFSKEFLRLPELLLPPLVERRNATPGTRQRPRVGMLSPLFCASPVYFLTIAKWQQMAQHCDLVLLNRGHKVDWATAEFRALSSDWMDVQHMSAADLARSIHGANLDVLYDLGGWMDPVGLQALSVKPARQQYKWVGGQSVTTGLESFDGWVGDIHHTPMSMQHFYSEPILHIKGGYATYTPPPYLPKPNPKKLKTPCIFSNPAKVSRPFLERLAGLPGKKVFIHRQFRYPQVQERIAAALDGKVEFVIPATHEEALQEVNRHAAMIDTFPYSSGLTAREALSMGTQIQVLHVGNLFCERHTAFIS